MGPLAREPVLVSEENRRPWWAFGCSAELTRRDLANMRRLNIYVFLTMFSWLAVILVLSRELLAPTVGVGMIALPVVLGFYMVRAAFRFLRDADELTRRIQIEAMAVGFGAGFVANLLGEMAIEVREMMQWTLQVEELFIPLVWMCVAYSAALYRLQRKYCR